MTRRVSQADDEATGAGVIRREERRKRGQINCNLRSVNLSTNQEVLPNTLNCRTERPPPVLCTYMSQLPASHAHKPNQAPDNGATSP